MLFRSKGIIDFLNQYEEAVKVDPRSPQEMIDEAVQTAKQSDVVVAVVGEAQGMAHEASCWVTPEVGDFITILLLSCLHLRFTLRGAFQD